MLHSRNEMVIKIKHMDVWYACWIFHRVYRRFYSAQWKCLYVALQTVANNATAAYLKLVCNWVFNAIGKDSVSKACQAGKVPCKCKRKRNSIEMKWRTLYISEHTHNKTLANSVYALDLDHVGQSESSSMKWAHFMHTKPHTIFFFTFFLLIHCVCFLSHLKFPDINIAWLMQWAKNTGQ